MGVSAPVGGAKNGFHGIPRYLDLHWLAASTISETEKGFVRGWWAAHPAGEPRPVLAAVVERQKTLAKERRRTRELVA